MARDYAVVTPRFWTGDTGRRLRGRTELQVVAAYLMTCPSANMVGLYYLPLPTLSHETGIPLEGASKALRSLSEEGFAYYDPAQEIVWVPEMGAHQVGPSLKPKDHRIGGAVREAVQYRKCRYYRDFVSRYSACWNLPPMPECQAEQVPEPSPLQGPSKPLRSQDQDQDHDQDQEPAAAGGANEDAPARRIEIEDGAGDRGAGPPRWPKAVAFRQALTDAMGRTALYPVGGREVETWSSLEASLESIPQAAAVEFCQTRILDMIAAGKRQPGVMSYFAQVLADEAIRRRERPRPVTPADFPSPTPELLRAHPEAAEEWAGYVAAVKAKAHPDPVGQLTGLLAMLEAKYTEAT
jgi:hypothetical protein